MIDCHVHTARCGHGQGTVAEYVARAAAVGVDVLTLTEHLPLPFVIDPNREYSMPEEDLGDYITEVTDAAVKAQVADGGVTVLCGIEADWLPEHEAHVREQLARFDFDVVLGSVHFVDGWAFDDPAHVDRYPSIDITGLWERYFEMFMGAASSGLFDVMAHPDLVKKFGFRPQAPVDHLYEAAAEVMAASRTAVEVSSAGLRKPCAEIYPSLGFLTACRRMGVPATFGSDAHAPEEVASGYGEARELLLTAGYESLVYFRDRQPVEVAL